jgi:hypothetical protein
MRRLPLLTFAALAFVLGCGDRSPVTAPNAHIPRFDISDGAHASGNDGFFFLPPMVKEPVGNPEYKDELFHGGMQPHVNIWELPSGTPCLGGIPFKHFPLGQILVGDEKYAVNWDTKEKPLADTKVYRVQACVGDVELGYADIKHVDNGSELKNVATGEYVALVEGRTLPIKFRIEHGALCQFDAVCTSTFVDADVGGTFYAGDEGAAIHFDPGDLPGDVVLTIERVPVLPGAPCVADAAVISAVFLQFEGCYRMTTAPDLESFDPPGFTGQVEAAVCLEDVVPPSLRENVLLHKFDEGDPVQRPDPITPPFPFDCEGFSGTPAGGPVSFARERLQILAAGVMKLFAPRPLYAVDGGLGCILRAGDVLSTFFWGLVVTGEVSAGNNQEALVGTAVPIAPEVTVMTFHADDPGDGEPVNEPVEGVPVTFTVTGGGGSLVNGELPASSVPAVTDDLGIARLPRGWAWKLGAEPGVNTLVAFGPFENGEDSPPTFTAQAVAPDWIVESITLAPASFPNTLDEVTFSVIVRNVGQTPTRATTLSFLIGAPDIAAQTLPVGTLAPGAAQTITTLPLTIGTAATYNATATVDPGNSHPELSETNNVRSLSYTIGLPPDLTVASFTVSPSSPTVADVLTLTAIVRNDGPGTSRATQLMIDFGGESVINAPRFPVPSLGPGATHVVSRLLGRQVAQTYLNNAVADVADATPETNETNNGLGLTFRVDDLVGLVSDAVGDATPSSVSPSPDLVTGSIEVDGGMATLKVRFAERTFNAATSHVGFNLDIDQNPATGVRGVDTGTNDDDIIGVDYLVNIGSSALGGQAEILHFFTGGGFTRKNFGTVIVVTNGLDVTIPLAELGGDEGRMNFKVTVQSLIDPDGPGFTGIVDYMADVGSPPTVVDRRLIIGSLSGSAWYAKVGRLGQVTGLE